MSKKRSTLAKIFDYKMILHDFIKLTGALPVLIDLRVKRIFTNKTKGLLSGKYIISANHISYEDPVIICAAFLRRRVGFLATHDLFEKKLLSFFLKHYGVIPINKDNPSMSSFKKAVDFIDRGHIMCVFPEGMIVHEDHLGAFKSGIVMMAVMADADILPTYIHKRESRLKRQVVVIGEKINYKDYVKGPFPTIEEINNVTTVLLEKEKELEQKYYEYMDSKKKKAKE